ncbi:MAG: polyvinylalcohol dehydrogenase [Candidatus Omnitrophota bacterium]|jgi:outer membrane protein assembly factor BamB|nr:MAG: polyvinylalcohol dehydrogenase [Candidatus Omnitrophota bacterium]
MKESVIGKIVVIVLAVTGLVSLYDWLVTAPPFMLEERVPGMDKADLAAVPEGSRFGPDGELIRSAGVPAEFKGAWPCFRGKDLDNISKDQFTPIPSGSGFPLCWAIEVGEGFAGAVILDGCVYMLDYDREKQADALRCLSLADGAEIWRYSYPVSIKRNHGMSRTIPYVTDDFVVAIGPKCHVTCLHSQTGDKKWSLDLVYAYNAEVPPWYAGQCPLVDQGRVILAPGGTALIIAVDSDTGETIWETPNPHDWKMTHSSVMPMDFHGKRTYVYCAGGGVVGVSAEDGRIVWEYPGWKINIANVPSPLIIGEDRIFLSGGYNAGSVMLRLEEKEGQITPTVLFRMEPERFGSTQHTPILYEGHIYGVRPDGQLVCFDPDGNEKWTSTGANKFGLGPYMIAGSMIYVMNDTGLLSRVEATSEAFRLVDQTQLLQGHDSWTPIAFASGRMILRDLTRMICVEAAVK